MLLTYSKDRFVDAIKNGSKIHTIRQDKPRRWKSGMKIHHWRGNPRNRKNNPYPFLEGICYAVEDIKIERSDYQPDGVLVTINGCRIHPRMILDIARNDGLTIDEFRRWFVPPGNDVFEGRIIHFTNFKYTT